MLLNPDHYRQAITSKCLQVTNTRGLRIKTTTEAGLSKIVSWDYSLDQAPNHAKALIDHATELKWLDKNDYAIGSTRTGYVLVLIPKVIND
jgi:hypothetical protein